MTAQATDEPIPARGVVASRRVSGGPVDPAESYRVDTSHPASPVLLARAESRYRERRRRDATLGGAHDLFGEPSWDILLDLFIARGRGRPVSVSSACIAAAAPQSTALRYVGMLERVGLIRRSKDPCDGRRRYLELTDVGLSEMKAHLAE